jgi:PLP dependent protein
MTPSEQRALLRNRLASVDDRIRAACARAGRRRSDVTLVAVTKSVDSQVAALLPELGVFDLGESRPQELWRKAAALPATVRWHLIGHLQRNKVERTLPLVECVHSVDSLRLLEALDREVSKLGRPVRVLLEVNVSGEARKSGFAPADVPALAAPLARMAGVRVEGLMTMAALLDDPEACRPAFAGLRSLRDRLRAEWGPLGVSLHHLSMGMSNDFEVAVEEGATMVRIGTTLFEGLPGPEDG